MKMMQYPWNFGDNSMNPKTISGYLAKLRAVFVLPISVKTHSLL